MDRAGSSGVQNTDAEKMSKTNEDTHTSEQLTALVVDENVVDRTICATILQTYGVRTTEVENGMRAVNSCAMGDKFDMIFMEKDTRIMNGIQATRRLRDFRVESLIVGISSDSNSEQEFRQAGADEFMLKPLNPRKILDLLEGDDD